MAVKSGRVVIVTGAGTGLGRAYALRLAALGMRVVVNNRRRELDAQGRSSAQQVVDAIRAAGGEAVANEADARDPAAGVAMVGQALQTWGRLDALVANAGVEQHAAFHRIGLEDFLEIFEINFHGSLRVAHAAYAHMRGAGHGRIVLSTSSAGLHGLHGLSAYSASKAAIIGLMRAIAAEGAPRDVCCNAIAPYAATRMTAGHGDPEVMARLPVEQVVPLVELLVDPGCRINGQVVVAGGGRFRRASSVEGPGVAYAEPGAVTAAQLLRDWERIAALDGAYEFPDALAAFADFLAPPQGAASS
ncbi:MAG: SDR family NAD(P)-dependent oxidoreductase [Steroidobacteraceae bacterium]